MGEQLNPTFIAERISIKVLTREEVKPSEILTRSRAQFGTESLSNTRGYEWNKSFLKDVKWWKTGVTNDVLELSLWMKTSLQSGSF